LYEDAESLATDPHNVTVRELVQQFGLVGLLFLTSPFRGEEPSYTVVIKRLPVLS
jgi:hypothetical protein